MVKFLTGLIIAVIMILLMWTILGDITPVTFGLSDEVPQKWVASGFFVMGLLLGWLLALPKNLALRWSTRQLRKENDRHKATLDRLSSDKKEIDTAEDVPPLTM